MTPAELLTLAKKLERETMPFRNEEYKVAVDPINLIPLLERLVELEALAEEMAGVLVDLNECPKWPDDATIPKAGVDANPSQVIFEMSIGLLRIRALQSALAEWKAFKEGK